MNFLKTIKGIRGLVLLAAVLALAYSLWLSELWAQTPSVTLTADGGASASYASGGTVDLAWNITDTNTCTITGTDGYSYTIDDSVTSTEFPFGLVTVSPAGGSVSYTLNCTGSTGATDYVTVYAEPTITLSVPPGSPIIAVGETTNTTVTLTTDDALSCDDLTSSVPVYFAGSAVPSTSYSLGINGSVNVSGINQDVTFSITCIEPGGGYPASDSVLFDVTVDASGAPGTISLSANPSTVNGIEWTSLSYNTSRIVSCQRGETPSRAGSESWAMASAPLSAGNYPVVVDSDTTFWVQCIDLNGSTITESVTVDVDISSNPNYCWDDRYSPFVLTEVTGGITKAPNQRCVIPTFTASCPWAHNPSAGIYVYEIDGHVRSRYNHQTPVDDGHYYPKADFDGAVRDDSTSSQSSDPAIQISLPSGDYDVSIYSWDSHNRRIDRNLDGVANDPQVQNHEEVEVVLYDAFNTQIFKSNATPDLADGVESISWFGKVNNGSTISGATRLRAKVSDAAILETDSSPGMESSVVAGCVKFESTEAAPILDVTRPACPFTDSLNRTVIEFPDNAAKLRSDSVEHTEWQWYEPLATGAHVIRVAVWDGYATRGTSPSSLLQNHESVNVEVIEPDGTPVLITSETPDLPEGQDSGLQVTTLTPSANLLAGGSPAGYWLRVNHAYPLDTITNSLYALCMAVDGPAYASSMFMDLQTVPNGLTVPGNINLTWSSTDADSCALTSSPNVISKNTVNGSQSVTLPLPNTTYTFTFTCQEGTNLPQTIVKTVGVGASPNLSEPNVWHTPSSATDPLTSDYDFVQITFNTANSGGGDIIDNTATRIRYDEGNDGSYEGLQIVTVPPLLAGQSSGDYTRTFSNVPFGHNKVIVNVDHTDKVLESNESDNVKEIFFTLLPVADIDISIETPIVDFEETTNINWDTTAIFPMACTVTGPGVNVTFDPSIAGPTGTTVSAPAKGETDYTLECVEPITGTVFTDTDTLRVTSVMIES